MLETLHLKKPAMPLSLEISFSNKTTWWGPDYLEHCIPAGWCVLVRGDTEHAGGANHGDSEDLRLRAHYYFDHPALSSKYRYAKKHESYLLHVCTNVWITEMRIKQKEMGKVFIFLIFINLL